MINKEPTPLQTYTETKEKALRLLEFRTHSQKELCDKLKRCGADEGNIIKTIEFLKNYGLINDKNYAHSLSNDLKNLKKYGKNRIKNELYKRGIATEIIDEVLLDLDEYDEDELFGLVEKKLKGDFSDKNKQKTIRYFIYRGYGIDEIKKALDKLENEY